MLRVNGQEMQIIDKITKELIAANLDFGIVELIVLLVQPEISE
jgi:hypothetical protein